MVTEVERYVAVAVTIASMVGAGVAWWWQQRRLAAREAEEEQNKPIERLIVGMQRTIDDLRADVTREERRGVALQRQVNTMTAQHLSCLARLAEQERESERMRGEIERLRRLLESR